MFTLYWRLLKKKYPEPIRKYLKIELLFLGE